jgi:hypothetical protein
MFRHGEDPAMSEVSALITELPVVLIREVGLIKSDLQMKGMANSDIRINEPARVPFQQLSLTERSLDSFSIDCLPNWISNRQLFNNQSLDSSG